MTRDEDYPRRADRAGFREPEIAPVVAFDTGKLPVGTLIGGIYKVESVLGAGGMSIVYRCHDTSLNRYVAVKVLRNEIGSVPQALMRFQREGQAVAQLSHPNIVKIFALQTTETGQPFLVMEIVTGTALSAVLASQGALPVFRVSKYVSQICDALETAHAAGIVHRDLKPQNIMLINPGRPDEYIKILDFGIAKVMTEGSARATQTGEIFGSPTYMSPEQSLGKPVDASSDQYSLGCVIFELLTGRPPFNSESSLEVMMAHVQEEPPTLKKVSRKEFPAYVENTIARMLSKDPRDRFSDLEEVKRGFFGEQKFAKPTKKKNPKAKKSDKKVPIAVGVAALTVLISVGAYFAFANHSKPSAQPIVAKTAKTESSEPAVRGDSLPSLGLDDMLKPQLQEENCLLTYMRAHPEAYEVDLTKVCENITDQGLAALRFVRLSSLHKINLRKLNISSKGIEHLVYLPHLSDLNIDGITIDDNLFVSLRKMTHLQALDIGNSDFTDKNVKDLDGLPLENLALNQSQITNAGLKGLSAFPDIRKLDLHKNSQLTDGALNALRGNKKLEELNLDDTGVSGAPLSDPTLLPNLKRIQLTLTNARENLQSLVHRKLICLHVGNDKISDSDLEPLMKITSLIELCVKENPVTDKGLLKLIKLPHLRSLDLRETRVTPAGLKEAQQILQAQDRKIKFKTGEGEGREKLRRFDIFGAQ